MKHMTLRNNGDLAELTTACSDILADQKEEGQHFYKPFKAPVKKPDLIFKIIDA